MGYSIARHASIDFGEELASLDNSLRKSDLFRGRYLFHFHTTFTDGQLAVEDYFSFAVRHGVDSLVFLEHIRKKPTYDVEALFAEVKCFSEKTAMRSSVGFEAKLLPGGDLDIDDRDLERADVIGIAEHTFPDDSDLLKSSFFRALDRAREHQEKTFVWVHPGLWFQKRGISPGEYGFYWSMLKKAQDCDVKIERNLRYRLVGDKVLPQISPESIVLGADAHNVTDLKSWESVQ